MSHSPLRHRGLGAAVGDAKALWLLNRIEERCHALKHRHDAVQRRLAERRKINDAFGRGEPIAVVWSGTDCDGVRYSGSIHWVNPHDVGIETWTTLRTASEFRREVFDHIAHTYEWADGPCGYYLMTRDEVKAAGIQYESRDLGMEAFENGHAHCIHT